VLEATYNDWTLVSLSPLTRNFQIIAIIAVIAACSTVLWSYRQSRRRWPLTFLRLCAAVLIIGFFIEPALQLRVVRKVRNRLAIVVDRSVSMALKTATGRSRHEHVLARLQADADDLTSLGESHVVELFDLEGPLTNDALVTPPNGDRTDLLTALESARDTGTGRPLAGIVLFSDGADNADLEHFKKNGLSSAARERLEHLGAPVNVVEVTASDAFKDVAVVDVRTDEFAFVHNTLEIDVYIETTGFNTPTLPVTLRREGVVVATQEAVAIPGETLVVHFATKPDKIGSFVYSVSVPSFAGEAIATNNERSFVLQVIRDKIRVLQVAGRPSWDERFLRQHLKENPNVDLISFFILRSPTDDPAAPEEELALIPFPVNELFTTELESFDVIIFQNFDYRLYNMDQYLQNIRDKVFGGLGFVMIGGNESFSGGGYAGTPIDEIVPLRMDAGELSRDKVSPVITTAGRRHPTTDLARGSGSNERLWQQLPGWTSLNRTGGLVHGATALVADASLRSLDGEPAPLVAVMDAGQGRSMAIATDSMWRWRFAMHKDGGAAERAYHRFWSNALHWLVRDPEHSRIRVVPSKRRFDRGEKVDVSFIVRGSDYQPVPFAQLRVALDQEFSGSHLDDVLTGEAGTAQKNYEDLPAGAYRISAEATAAGESLGKGAAVFLIEDRSLELDRGAPRPEVLEAIARTTKGRSLPLDGNLWEALQVVDPDVVEVDQRRNIELWDNAWALLIAVALLALEWAMRRRFGYL